ncbi:hypothetical protein TSMEX_006528 [Taenia solium]|eukprot:TsM_000982700 transcript=TsM_000982700 gene=TsM_000982700
MSYIRRKKYCGRHHEGDLVQIYGPIPPSRRYCKFYHPRSRDSFRVGRVPSPTNYLSHNAQLHAQPTTVHYNKIRPYKDAPPVDYEGEVYALVEEAESLDGLVVVLGRPSKDEEDV